MIETINGRYTIKQIFQDNNNWENFKIEHSDQLRPSVIEEVEKVLNCRDPLIMGYHQYKCPKCGKIERIVPHSCKSRFCSSCGKVATDNWMDKSLNEFLDVPYHHLVFTIPQELRNVFLHNRSLLHILFKAAGKTLLEWCRDTGEFIPGIVCISHTFGSILNFNPHIHMLLTEGGLDLNKYRWINNEFVPWNMLKARWKYHIVTLLKPELKKMIQEKRAGNYYSKLGIGGTFYSFLG